MIGNCSALITRHTQPVSKTFHAVTDTADYVNTQLQKEVISEKDRKECEDSCGQV